MSPALDAMFVIAHPSLTGAQAVCHLARGSHPQAATSTASRPRRRRERRLCRHQGALV